MGDILPIVIAVVVTALVVGFVCWKFAISYHTKIVEAKIGNADEKAREIIDEALNTAETKKKEALLEAKEESIKTKNELEKEAKDRRAEVQRYEKRVLA